MEKIKVLFSLLFYSLSLYMYGQNYGFGYTLQFFPYNFYEWKEDVNKDYIVDTQDVLRIYESIQNAEGADLGPDVNLDKVVDTQDVLKVYEYIKTEASPTIVKPDDAMDVITTAINLLDYYAIVIRYPVCRMSIVAPTDKGLLTYIDPVSVGQNQTQIWKFMLNPRRTASIYSQIQAVVYAAEKQADGSWLQTDSLRTIVGNSATDQVFNRLKDILENCIVPEDFIPEKHYYKTLSGNYIYVNRDGGDLTVSGGFQMDSQKPVKVAKTGSMINGEAYLVDDAIYPSYRSVSDVLSSKGQFSKFYELLQGYGLLCTSDRKDNWSSVSENGNLIYIPDNSNESTFYFFDSYNYTMYVPTNAAMEEAYIRGLPTLKKLEDAYEYDEEHGTDSAAHLRKVVVDFVKYHIQEESLFAYTLSIGSYASRKLKENGLPYKLAVETTENGIKIEDESKQTQWVTTDKMCNTMVREYWLNNRQARSASLIATSSSVVLHAVDRPLLYKYNMGAGPSTPENNQFRYAPDVFNIPSNY